MVSENMDERQVAGETQHMDERPVAGETQQVARSDTGLDENVAGALSYFLGVITGVLFFVIDDRPFVRFHAAQSMVLAGALIAVFIGMSVVNTILFATMLGDTFLIGSILWLGLSLVWLAVTLGGFGLWIYMMYSAYTGKQVVLPVVGGIAQNIAAK
jgi:uncharacterized membrane protein